MALKLQLKCDGANCGKIGTPEEIFTNYDNRDLCERCTLIDELQELTEKREKIRVEHQRYANELRDVNQQVTNIVNRLKQQNSGDGKNKTAVVMPADGVSH